MLVWGGIAATDLARSEMLSSMVWCLIQCPMSMRRRTYGMMAPILGEKGVIEKPLKLTNGLGH